MELPGEKSWLTRELREQAVHVSDWKRWSWDPLLLILIQGLAAE